MRVIIVSLRAAASFVEDLRCCNESRMLTNSLSCERGCRVPWESLILWLVVKSIVSVVVQMLLHPEHFLRRHT